MKYYFCVIALVFSDATLISYSIIEHLLRLSNGTKVVYVLEHILCILILFVLHGFHLLMLVLFLMIAEVLCPKLSIYYMMC